MESDRILLEEEATKKVSKKKGSIFHNLKRILQKLEETGSSYTIEELAEMLEVSSGTVNGYMSALRKHFPVGSTKEKDDIKYSLNKAKCRPDHSDFENRLVEATLKVKRRNTEDTIRRIKEGRIGPGETSKKKGLLKNDRFYAVLKKLVDGWSTIEQLEMDLRPEFRMSRKSIERDIHDIQRSFPVQIKTGDSNSLEYSIDKRTLLRATITEKQQFALAFAQMVSPFGKAFREIMKEIAQELIMPAAPRLDANILKPFVLTAAQDSSEEVLQDKLKTLAEASIRKRCVEITYRTLSTRITDRKDLPEISERIIEPAFLFPAMDGLFYTMAFCHTREKWLIFAVDQILTCKPVYENAERELTSEKMTEFARGFGPFLGGKEEEIVIRFTPQIKPYIERRRWHISDTPRTKKPVDDEVFGPESLELRITTTGAEGVKHWLKQWIPDFRVLEPQWLKKEMEEEIAVQLRNFRKV